MSLDKFTDPQPNAKENPEEFKKWLIRRLRLAIKEFGQEAVINWIRKKVADHLLVCEILEFKEVQNMIKKRSDLFWSNI